MSDKSTILIAVLSSGGLFAIVGAFINGFFTKKKLGAEATQIITQAASGVVSDMRQSLEQKTTEMAQMRLDHAAALAEMKLANADAIAKMMKDFAEEREDWRRVLQLHVAWDYIAIEKLTHLNVELPPPPPILPPNR